MLILESPILADWEKVGPPQFPVYVHPAALLEARYGHIAVAPPCYQTY